MKLKPVKMWAWAIQNLENDGWQLCYYAYPNKETLIRSGKPSPEARPVRLMCSPHTLPRRMRGKR